MLLKITVYSNQIDKVFPLSKFLKVLVSSCSNSITFWQFEVQVAQFEGSVVSADSKYTEGHYLLSLYQNYTGPVFHNYLILTP